MLLFPWLVLPCSCDLRAKPFCELGIICTCQHANSFNEQNELNLISSTLTMIWHFDLVHSSLSGPRLSYFPEWHLPSLERCYSKLECLTVEVVGIKPSISWYRGNHDNHNSPLLRLFFPSLMLYYKDSAHRVAAH